MGRGRELSEWHASPWRQAIAELTDTDPNEWGMSKTRVYPRPMEEVKKGIWSFRKPS
jgi:hypothetical protein